eukprot:jgi/Bigna1/137252/aug1.38_g11960
MLKNPSTGSCKAKRPDGECELQPADVTITLSEPGCEEQLLHRDFGRDVMDNFTQNGALSLFPLLVSMSNTRHVRVIDSAHNEEGRKMEKVTDKGAKLIALTPGDTLAMHPFLTRSGGSNLSKDPSTALFTIVTAKDKARTSTQTLDVVGARLDVSVERDGKHCIDHSSISGAGLGLHTRALLSHKNNDKLGFRGTLFEGSVPTHDKSEEFCVKFSEGQRLHCTMRTSDQNLASFCNHVTMVLANTSTDA